MKFTILRIKQFSGKKADVFSVRVEDSPQTLFERFLSDHTPTHRIEVKDLLKRLRVVGHDTGARPDFFKPHEGNPGDFIEALYDNPGRVLRLYCLRYDETVLVLGGGGPKPKSARALQDVPALKAENYLLRRIAKILNQADKAGDVDWDAINAVNGLTLDSEEY